MENQDGGSPNMLVMVDAVVAVDCLPKGFHLKGQTPNVILDVLGQHVLRASIPVSEPLPLYSISFYEDYHSMFTGTVEKTVGAKVLKERSCCLCLEAVNTTSNNVTMRNHFQSEARWKSHMPYISLRSWPKSTARR